MWFKEYTMNTIIQPIHLLLYTALVGSSVALAVKNPVYAIVAIGFMVPAEKFIKKMFKIDSETASGMGSLAAGALGMAGLQRFANMGRKIQPKIGAGSGNKESSNSEDSSSDRNYIREANSDNLAIFGNTPSNDNKKGSPPEGGKNDVKPPEDNDPNDYSEQLKAEDKIRDEIDKKYGTGMYAPIFEDPERKNDPRHQLEKARKEREAEKEKQEKIEQFRKDGKLPEEFQKENGTPKRKTIKHPKLAKMKDKIKSEAKIQGKYMQTRAKDMAPSVLKAAKGTARFAAKTGGAMAGGVLGITAGAATGEGIGKTMSYMVAGGVAGNMIAGNATNLAGTVGAGILDIPGKFERRDEKIQYMKDEARYGAEVARQRKIERNNAQAENEFFNSKKEQDKWEDVRGKIGYQGSTKDLMKVVASYKRAGVKDDEMIENALKVEKSYGSIGGSNHEKVKAITSFAAKNKFDQSFVTDSDKNKKYNELLAKKINTKAGRKEANDMFTKLMGF